MKTLEQTPKKRPIRKVVLSLISLLMFCTILGYGSLKNFGTLKQILSGQKISLDSWKETASNIESQLKNQFYKREKLIDLYGISMKALGKSMIGNFEFAKDEDGIIQRFEAKSDAQAFEKSVSELRDYGSQTGTPLVFVEIPNKAEGFSLSQEVNFSGQYQTEVSQKLQEQGIDVLKLSSLMESDPDAPERTDFFLRTDVHFSTNAEFWMAQKLVEHLQYRYGVSFHDPEIIFDEENYQVDSYEFLGNTARSVGRYFVGTDQFELYTPKFETRFQLIDKNLEVIREGDFTKVQMNGMQEKDVSLYTYLVTNYGHYPEPYYEYQNLKATNGPNILVISDSTFMRGTAFLSLACNNLTVVDTRYMQGTEYLEYALASKEYDAIVVCGTSAAFLQQGFSVKTQLPPLPTAPLQTSNTWIGVNGIWIDTVNNQKPSSPTQLTVDSSAKTVRLKGWAADFNAGKPLSQLYLVAGEQVIRCNYGLQRQGVADRFGADLLNTGFTVTIPASFLEEGAVDKLQFVQISADGSHQYEPVVASLRILE